MKQSTRESGMLRGKRSRSGERLSRCVLDFSSRQTAIDDDRYLLSGSRPTGNKV